MRARRRPRLSLRRARDRRHVPAFWSRDETGRSRLAGEKAAFERFIDFVIARSTRDPTLHVYHYAPYEPTALKRLMGRHGTREDEVDRLLRGRVLVNLYASSGSALRASVECYSIKKIETVLRPRTRDRPARRRLGIVAFEHWLELGEGERPASDHLDAIERYNRDDVVSNAATARLARGPPHRAGRSTGRRGAAAGDPRGRQPDD